MHYTNYLHQNPFRIYSFLFLFLFFSGFPPTIYAGSAGVKNGTISGQVTDSSGLPLSGVSVAAVMESPRTLIRNTFTNAGGVYTFNHMPLGLYVLGFSLYGFESITTEKGTTQSQSAIGEQIRVAVESGAHVQAPRVSMKSLGSYGKAAMILKFVDEYTGEVLEKIQVSAGNVSTDTNGASARLELSVLPGESGKEIPLKAEANGYESLDAQIRAIAGQTMEATVAMTPKMASVQGHIRWNLSTPFPKDRIFIQADGVPSEFLDPVIEEDGSFRVKLPVSTEKKLRSFTLRILGKGITPAVVRVTSPQAGAYTIPSSISLQFETIRVSGNVMSKNNATITGSPFNQAYIRGLGLSAPIQSDNYIFPYIPTGIPLSVEVFIRNQEGKTEKGEIDFVAVQNGTGTFVLPTVTTSE